MADVYVILRINQEGHKSLYGWTKKKWIAKLFFKQRTKHKYACKIMSKNQFNRILSSAPTVRANNTIELDFAKLYSNTNKETVYFITTSEEMQEMETAILHEVQNASSLGENPNTRLNIETFVDMIINLKEYYTDAIDYIGYWPVEIESLFPTESSLETDLEEIQSAYENISREKNKYEPFAPRMVRQHPGWRVIYSLEAFIHVWREYL